MRNRQLGVSLGGLMVVLVFLMVIGLLALKVIPPYLEFNNIKKAVQASASGSNPAEIRKAFDARGAIDDFTSVKASDLEITKEGGRVVVSASWRKEVPLFWNLGLYWDFVASSKDE
jgi:Tfp pilus assembly major pilin PilA